MGTVGQQVSVSAAVTAQGTLAAGTTLYTCPANSYAQVNIFITQSSGAGSGSLTIDNRTLYQTGFQTGPNGGVSGTGSNWTMSGVVIGPGQVLKCNSTSGTPAESVFVSGVQFTNGS